ncbi:hypothetical protein TNCV_3176081 [Trichonephila clavipes]|nr:hypothetical protein TNCV_3176081 [Trichonephila clavipes]
MSTKLAWGLNKGGLASDRPLDRDICLCASVPKVPLNISRVDRLEEVQSQRSQAGVVWKLGERSANSNILLIT